MLTPEQHLSVADCVDWVTHGRDILRPTSRKVESSKDAACGSDTAKSEV